MHKLIPHEVILVSSIPNCYFCEQEAIIKPGPYDFATAMGPWANGCEMHYHMYKTTSSLGTGTGQLWVTADQVEPDDDNGSAEKRKAMINDLRVQVETGLIDDDTFNLRANEIELTEDELLDMLS